MPLSALHLLVLSAPLQVLPSFPTSGSMAGLLLVGLAAVGSAPSQYTMKLTTNDE